MRVRGVACRSSWTPRPHTQARLPRRRMFAYKCSECCGDPPGRPHPRASATRCAQVRSYRYTSPEDSVLEKLFLQRFWNFGVRFFPTWFAPNLMTTVGLVFALGAYGTLLWHSPDLDGSLPAWAAVACAAVSTSTRRWTWTASRRGAPARDRPSARSPIHGADAIAACIYGAFIWTRTDASRTAVVWSSGGWRSVWPRTAGSTSPRIPSRDARAFSRCPRRLAGLQVMVRSRSCGRAGAGVRRRGAGW